MPDAETIQRHVPRRIAVDRPLLVGRAAGMVDVQLEHPTVSLRHAKLFPHGGRAWVKDLHSSAGTFIDGERVRHDTVLPTGCRLSIGPYQFTFDGLHLNAVDAVSATLALGCLDVSRYATHRVTGEKLTLLHQLSLAVTPRELICLIGPSGCGKSTLLSTLAGRTLPDRGRVLYGGVNLHSAFDAVKHDIAVVPQREALHGGLTVRQTLWYAAGLRLPADTSADELDRRVESLLDEVGLANKSAVRVRNLSGGQRKRLCLAIEICHTPRMIFIDEVTSGLDERADADMMRLFRGLAERGRSLVCITHNTLNIERSAHRVVVLAAGGRLACVGTPAETCGYFGISRLGDVYAALERRQPQEWAAAFRGHPLELQHVAAPLRRLPTAEQPAGRRLRFKAVTPREPSPLSRQMHLLTGRLLTMLSMNPKALLAALGQALFVGLMLVAFFGDLQATADPATRLSNCRTAAFLAVVTAFWLGCNNAAPEIARERLLFERERSVAISATAYYASKILVLGGISVAQAAIVFGLMATWCNFPGHDGLAGVIVQGGVTLATGFVGTLVGLAISAVARTEEIAIRTVPLVLIPQIVLADVVADLHGWLEHLGTTGISTYWAFRGFTSGVAAYSMPGENAPLLLPALAMLAAHGLVAMAITCIGLRRRPQEPD
ncbi:MAG: ATP-binding cassette domain-containing protein [Planctomycetaceae bacterium]